MAYQPLDTKVTVGASDDNAAPRPARGDGVCRICGSDEEQSLLIAPCDCSGSLRLVHTHCLQRWILSRPTRQQENNALNIRPAPHNEDGRFTCEICHSDYRIRVTYTFVWSRERCCTWRSLNHIFEMVILLIMLCVCIAMWPVLSRRSDGQEGAFGSGQADHVVIPVISVVMVLLTLYTLYKVFNRWKRANSVIDILPDDHAVAAGEAPRMANIRITEQADGSRQFAAA